MSVRAPRLLIFILEGLTEQIRRSAETARNTLNEASYTQGCAHERIEQALRHAAIATDTVEGDRENVQDAQAEVASLLSKCTEAKATSHETMSAVMNALDLANATLQYWQEELRKALAWLQRAEARLARAIREYEAAERNLQAAQYALERAEAVLRSCLKDDQRNCNSERRKYEAAGEEVLEAQQRLAAAAIELRLAQEEVEQAKARVNCCKNAVSYAEQAVQQAQIAYEHANQAVNSAERSLEEAEAAQRFVDAAQNKVQEEQELAEQMMVEVRQAATLTSEAQTHWQKGDRAAESTQRLATLACQELEYRIQQLYALNRPSGDFGGGSQPLFSVLGSGQVISSQPLPTQTNKLSGVGSIKEDNSISEFAKNLHYPTEHFHTGSIRILARDPKTNKELGYIIAGEQEELKGRKRVKIKDTKVADEYQGRSNRQKKGIGTMLFRSLENQMPDGIEFYFEANQAKEFWEKMGFKQRIGGNGEVEYYKIVNRQNK